MTPTSRVSMMAHRLEQAIFIISEQSIFAQISIQAVKHGLHGNHAEQEQDMALDTLLADRHINLQYQHHLVISTKKSQ